MKRKEIENLFSAYNRLAKQPTEDKDVFGLTEIALKISTKDIDVLRPFLQAEKKVSYKVGDVEINASGMVYSAELTEGNSKYLIFPNERVLYDTLYDLRQMIEHVGIFGERIKADKYYKAEQTDSHIVGKHADSIIIDESQTERE